MNYVEKTNRPASFVGLQMSNQVPARGAPSQFDYLFFGFLYTILAQVVHAQRERRFQRLGRVRFGDGDESYLFRRTATGSCGCLNSGTNVRESVAQALYLVWFRQHPGDNTIETKL